jgi:hypothetical protein
MKPERGWESVMRVVLIAFSNIEYTIELAEGLANHVDKVVLMIPSEQAERFKFGINGKVNLDPFERPRLRQVSNIVFVYKMFRRIGEWNPDVIHLQRGDPWLILLYRFESVLYHHSQMCPHSGDKE